METVYPSVVGHLQSLLQYRKMAYSEGNLLQNMANFPFLKDQTAASSEDFLGVTFEPFSSIFFADI